MNIQEFIEKLVSMCHELEASGGQVPDLIETWWEQYTSEQEDAKQPGYYIWLDATLVAGPFSSKKEAKFSLSPKMRKNWTWELQGGMESFLKIPTEAFSIEYHEDMP